jgi:hypothetical protein
MSAKRIGKSRPPKELPLSRVRLDELIDEALVDAYSDSEQATAFSQCWRTNLRCLLKHRSLA